MRNLFFILIILVACNNKKNIYTANLKKKVIIGFNSVMLEDSVISYKEFRKKYKFLSITYLTEGCSACKYKIQEWQRKKDKLPQSNNLAYVFIINTKNFAQYKDIVPFYVIIDSTNIFIKQNKHIPRELIDNTILIDKKNRICAAGEPFNSDEINNLYERLGYLE